MWSSIRTYIANKYRSDGGGGGQAQKINHFLKLYGEYE